MGELEYLRRMAEISCDTCCITIESDGKTITHEPTCRISLLTIERDDLRSQLAEAQKALGWAIGYLKKLVVITEDGAAYIRGTSTELAGFKAKLDEAELKPEEGMK